MRGIVIEKGAEAGREFLGGKGVEGGSAIWEGGCFLGRRVRGIKKAFPRDGPGEREIKKVGWTLEVHLAYHIGGEGLEGASELECTAQNKAFIYRNELANENPQEGYSAE